VLLTEEAGEHNATMGVRIAIAGLAVAGLLGGCAAASPVGVLTGTAEACVGVVLPGSHVEANVWAFRNGHLIGHKRVPSGTTYRFLLPPGSYGVTNMNNSPSAVLHVVQVFANRTTTVDLPDVCP